MINKLRREIKQNSFISSQATFKLAHRWQTKRSTSKQHIIMTFSVKNLMQRWHVFDEKRIDFIEIEEFRFSLSSSENSRKEESHANNIMTRRRRQKRIENFKNKKSIKNKQTIYKRTKLEKKNKKEKTFFMLRLIYCSFLFSHDSLSHSFSKIYNISYSWKMIVFDKF
jgi:hypothetical protein